MRPFSLAVVLALLLVVVTPVNQAAAATFTVNTTADSNGTCDDLSVGDCSLREAITAANTSPGADTISFAIPGTGPHNIAPTTELPTITDPVTIDGTTQQDYSGTPLIEINGTNAGEYADGLTIFAGNSTVRGLVINRFTLGSGIEIKTGGSNTIQGNYIGTDVTGTIALGNYEGISISGAVADTIIGGSTAGEGNLISGNRITGISVGAPAGEDGPTGTVIQGNYIGTDITGELALGNSYVGISVSGAVNAPGTLIGGPGAGEGNVISGNASMGVSIVYSLYITVENNIIGPDKYGMSALSVQTDYGVEITAGEQNIVRGNVISGNDQIGLTIDRVSQESSSSNLIEGNIIGLDAAGTGPIPNGMGMLVSGGSPNNRITGNRIGANSGMGIDLNALNYGPPDGITTNDPGDVDSGANSLQNFPVLSDFWFSGTTSNLSLALNSTPSTLFHIELFANTTCDESGYGEGEQLVASYDLSTDSSGNLTASPAIVGDLRGKYLTATATDPSGNTSEFSACLATVQTFTVTKTADTNDGVCDADCSLREAISAANASPGADTIAFGIPGPGPYIIALGSVLPLISDTVSLDGTSQPGYAGTPLIQIDGAAVGAQGLVIGGLVPNSVIRGISIYGFNGDQLVIGGDNTIVQSNYIGVTPSGTAPPNHANTEMGIRLWSSGNLIGGTAAGQGNWIAYNGWHGIMLYTPFSDPETNNRIYGNLITDNVGTGIYLGQPGGGVADTYIGGAEAGAGNVISGNLYGIEVGWWADGTVIQGNLIGTNSTGNAALPNTQSGIIIGPSTQTQIGGPEPGARNVIAGNLEAGIHVFNVEDGAVVEGNYIGIGADGVTAVPNETGVLVTSQYRNELTANRIAFNTLLGIDLQMAGSPGVTLNDLGDVDDGPNGLQNYPVLSDFWFSGTTSNLSLALNSTPSTLFHIELFANTTCDASGYGEGEEFVASYDLATDSSGNLTASPAIVGDLRGKYLTATATDPLGNTSEFSACLQTPPRPPGAENLLVNPSFEALTASRYVPPTSPPMVIVQGMELGVTQEGEQIGGLAVPPSTQRGMPYGWSEQNLNPLGTGNGWACTSVVQDGLCALRIRGNGQLQTVSQTVSAGGRAGDTYTLRFWSRGSALTGVVRARVMIFYPDGTSRTSVRTLPLGSYDWQEQILRVTPRRPYIRIEVVFEFQGSGTWWLDHTFLGRE